MNELSRTRAETSPRWESSFRVALGLLSRVSDDSTSDGSIGTISLTFRLSGEPGEALAIERSARRMAEDRGLGVVAILNGGALTLRLSRRAIESRDRGALAGDRREGEPLAQAATGQVAIHRRAGVD